jgi:hypothetical protein
MRQKIELFVITVVRTSDPSRYSSSFHLEGLGSVACPCSEIILKFVTYRQLVGDQPFARP